MAKILVDNHILELMPDFIQQVEKIVGEVLIVDSIAYGVNELLFKWKDFKENEVVLGRVNWNTNIEKLEITSINSTDNYLIHYA